MKKGISKTDPIIELVNGESDEEDENGDKGDCHPSVSDVDCQVGQLCLQKEFGLTKLYLHLYFHIDLYLY